MSEKKTGLQLLREPFPDHLISKLPKPTCSKEEYGKLPKGKCNICGGYHATSKTIHLDYVGHAALTDRLLDCDPEWNWEPFAVDEFGLPRFDKNGGLWIRLTVCGLTRPGYGNAKLNQYADIGSREKEVIGDALRNAAMRFGAALDLWHKGDLHTDDVEETSKEPATTEKPEPPPIPALPEDMGNPELNYCALLDTLVLMDTAEQLNTFVKNNSKKIEGLLDKEKFEIFKKDVADRRVKITKGDK
jgi:hypothetical protein